MLVNVAACGVFLDIYKDGQKYLGGTKQDQTETPARAVEEKLQKTGQPEKLEYLLFSQRSFALHCKTIYFNSMQSIGF